MKNIMISNISTEELSEFLKRSIKEVLLEIKNMPNNSIEELLDQKKAALLLGVSIVTLWDWRKKGILPFKKMGKRIYYSKIDLMKIKKDDEL